MRVRVLTYNIHHGEGVDGKSDLDRIAKIILDQHPDVVALQELDRHNGRSGVQVDQLASLAKLTGMQGFFGKTIDYREGGYGNGLLLRRDWHAVSVTNHPMPSPEAEARGALEIRVSISGDGQAQFRLLATHFSAHLSGESARLRQASYITKLADSSSLPVILAGDLNANPGSRVIGSLLEHWDEPIDLMGPALRSGRIDHVLYRTGKRGDKATLRRIINSQTLFASDHLPVLANIEIALPRPGADVEASGSRSALNEMGPEAGSSDRAIYVPHTTPSCVDDRIGVVSRRCKRRGVYARPSRHQGASRAQLLMRSFEIRRRGGRALPGLGVSDRGTTRKTAPHNLCDLPTTKAAQYTFATL